MSGTTIRQVKKDEVFIVELEEMASAGYQWKLIPQANIEIKDVRMKFDVNDGYEQTIGAPSKKLFLLQAKEAGEYELVFELCRPWEKNNIVRTFHDNINVSEDR